MLSSQRTLLEEAASPFSPVAPVSSQPSVHTVISVGVFLSTFYLRGDIIAEEKKERSLIWVKLSCLLTSLLR